MWDVHVFKSPRYVHFYYVFKGLLNTLPKNGNKCHEVATFYTQPAPAPPSPPATPLGPSLLGSIWCAKGPKDSKQQVVKRLGSVDCTQHTHSILYISFCLHWLFIQGCDAGSSVLDGDENPWKYL